MKHTHASMGLWLLSSLLFMAAGQVVFGQQNPSKSSHSKEATPQPIVIIGAVRKPSRFEFRENMRLKEVITCAGGLSDTAGKNLQIRNSGAPSCPNCSCVLVLEIPGLYNLDAVTSEQEGSNPVVRGGDIIMVWDSEPIFVTGDVVHPQAGSSKGPITLTQAIALAGVMTKYGRPDRIKIYRTAESRELVTVTADLKDISKGRAVDPVLQPFDIVEVGGKNEGNRPVPPIESFNELPMRPICEK